MTPEQQRKILEAAAKACGIDGRYVNAAQGIKYAKGPSGNYLQAYFNPLTNHADTAEMCAKLDINTFFYVSLPRIECWCEDHGDEQTIRHIEYHNRTDAEKAKAWRLSATIVAAKTHGYEP